MIGKVRVASRARKRRQISMPETPGSIQSRIEEVRRIFSQAQLGLVAARDAFHDVALRLQIVTDQQSHIDLVLDDENTRRGGDARTGDGLARLVHQRSAPATVVIVSSPDISSIRPRWLARAIENGRDPALAPGFPALNTRPLKTEWRA